MKKELSNQEEDWIPCQPGQIANIAAEQNAVSRREAMSKMAIGAVALASLGTATLVYLTSDKDNNPKDAKGFVNSNEPVQPNDLAKSNEPINTKVVDDGIAPISCREVVNLLPDYIEDAIENVKLLARVDKHLGHCNWCCDRRDELKAS